MIDISKCLGEGCPLTDTCRRYQTPADDLCGRKPTVCKRLISWSSQVLKMYQIACPFKMTCPVQPMTKWREKKQDCVKDWNTQNEVKNG